MLSKDRASRPLVVIASENEAIGLVQRLGLRRDPSFRFPAGQTEANAGFYRGSSWDLAITGVLEHNMVAASSLVLLRLAYEVPFVVNFGAVGFYRQGRDCASLALGDTVLVQRVCRFDVDDNVHWAPPIELQLPPVDLRSVTCVTGSRYSTPRDRESLYFPIEGHVEDMELYALAVLLQALEIPLLSLKFVTNSVSGDGRDQVQRNLPLIRERAESVLIQLLHECAGSLTRRCG